MRHAAFHQHSGSGSVFGTERRIRLGVWGLGRGLAVARAGRAVNIDVVAGCDTDERLRSAFAAEMPEAVCTADPDEFLSSGIDGVLIATYCPEHAEHAMAALRRGLHVLSEVTSFFTCAQGVLLVEEVERSGRVYQLAENYPWQHANRYLAGRWSEGYFGGLQYAEYSYVHDCLHLAYAATDGTAVSPGWQAHAWRSWLPWHYYCTHSLGPVMAITGERPIEVTALPGGVRLPGQLLDPPDGISGMAPSLVRFGGGGLMRNLMGTSTMDDDVQRLWGTRAASEIRGGRLSIRPGGRGHSRPVPIEPPQGELDRLAAATGHGGGDFWTLYHFANQILCGTPGFFDVYRAADVTLAGIQAYRSLRAGGAPQEIPDFRDPAVRDHYREDHFAPGPYDPRRLIYPAGAHAADGDPARAERFTDAMARLLAAADLWQEALHGALLFDAMATPEQALERYDALLDRLRFVQAAVADATGLLGLSPGSPGERVLRETLARVDTVRLADPACRAALTAERDGFARRLPAWEERPGEPLPQLAMRRIGFEDLPPVALPTGYTLRHGRGEDDAPTWCRVIGEAFGEALTAEEYRRRILSWDGYKPERLFFIVDPAGVECATAGAFGSNDVGYVHYVGTLPSHAGRGLGLQATLAALHSFRERGLPACRLTTDDHRHAALKTYHRLGFEPEITHRTHRVRWQRLAEPLGIEAFRASR